MRWFLLLFLSCAAPSASQGGARFKDVGAQATTLPPDALFAVCWPQDALAASRVALTFDGDDVIFEARDGATNSTARCIREIATSVAWPNRPKSLEAAPPSQPIDGWAALAWVKLLSSSRFGPERGLLDPAERVAACLAKGGATPASFIVRPAEDVYRVVPPALTDTERCVEATLAATAWPSSRELFLSFASSRGAPEARGDVSVYFGPDAASGVALEPQSVREALQLAGNDVAACWEAALLRRTAIGGARTFRFTVNDTGAVTRAWVTTSTGQSATAADALLDDCLHTVLLKTRFPPRAGDGFYTWVFATR